MGGVTLPFSRRAESVEGLQLCLLGHGRLQQPSCVRQAPAREGGHCGRSQASPAHSRRP